MSNLSANFLRTQKLPEIEAYEVAAGSRIYQGAQVMVVVGTGYAVRAGDTAGGRFVGIAIEEADNTLGAAGAISVRVYRSGRFPITLASVAITDKGKAVYATDDNTVALTSTNLVVVGSIGGIAATNTAWIDIFPGLVGVSKQAHVADPAALTGYTLTDSTGGDTTTPATLAAITNLDTLNISGLTQTADDTPVEITFNATWSQGQADTVDKNFKEAFDQIVAQKALNTIMNNNVAKLAVDLNAALVDLGVIRTKQIAIITQLENALVSATS
ncbi:MAG: hypothetical protein KKC03_13835 [Bacteroidetes bacterium]|nr:hypothetical protein [Bacteroidota bacterium]